MVHYSSWVGLFLLPTEQLKYLQQALSSPSQSFSWYPNMSKNKNALYFTQILNVFYIDPLFTSSIIAGAPGNDMVHSLAWLSISWQCTALRCLFKK